MDINNVKAELAMGLRLIAYKDVTLQVPSMAEMDQAMQESGWSAVSEITQSDNGTSQRYYYDTAQKTYVLASVDASGNGTVAKAEETDVLEKLSFPELKVLAGLIDKKSVAFIRIYSDKELAAASGDELAALQERKQKMIDEAEVALRKR